jgi:eukaryotic-like serine/threonine-protein kinase
VTISYSVRKCVVRTLTEPVSSPRLPPPSSDTAERLRRELTTPSAAVKTRRTAARALWAVPIGVAIVVAATGIVGSRAIDEKIAARVRDELETRRDACAKALRDWVELEYSLAQLIVDRRVLGERVLSALASDAPATRENKAAFLAALDDATRIAGFEAFALFDGKGREVVRSRGFNADAPLDSSHGERLVRVVAHGPKLVPLVHSLDGDVETRHRTFMMIATPVVEGDRAIGVLALQMAHARDFSRVVYEARVGRSGENFIFDRDGRMLSNSRFEDELRSLGLLAPGEESAGNFAVRDPGGNLLEGHKPDLPRRAWPLPWAVAHVGVGESGVTTTPFRDYRGVPVVGAFRWLEDLEMGVVAKMDAEEAFETLNFFRRIFWLLCALLITAAVILTLGAIVLRRLRVAKAPRQVGPYSLLEKIGEGAMGSVYRATHAMLRRPTAVKLLESWTPDAAPRFEREAQLTSQLTHPNTIAIYDYGRTAEGVFYYAMEHVEGIDLGDLVRFDGPMPPARVIHVLSQVCGSLAEAHALGLVHRDVKPSNIMVTVRGGEADVVKVLDFGLAKLVDPPEGAKLTRTGSIFGTPGFIPPETLKDPETYGPRGDLYAVGAVAYELLAGLPPFDRTNALEMWHLHVEVDPPPPSVRLGAPIPKILDETVMSLLAKDPDQRPDSAVSVIDLLDLCARVVGPWTQADARAWWETRGKALATRAGEAIKAAAAALPGTTRRFEDGENPAQTGSSGGA